ncbi:Gag-pol Polyprotein [Phytophthora palmivora]|uniref:Gag-pol Polyprotein n=1 Tax=Phytophthora palmivora TaxID=4796 RepID=A0A2P4XSV9_9STRA|nr:Gag-pol Polyprotein [Phytophthora palmivora]
MGLSNAPVTFNAGIRRILADLSEICQSYFDNIYVHTRSRSFDDHLLALDCVLGRLEEHNVFVKLNEIPCLGDYVGRAGIRIDPAKVTVLRDWSLPRTRSELQSFMCTAVYAQRFCNDFANNAAPRFDLLKGNGKQKIVWTDSLRKTFEFLKKSIGSTPILAIPDFDRSFHMRMDASDFAIGGVLFQEEGEGTLPVERPVAFGGRMYKDAEKKLFYSREKLIGDIIRTTFVASLSPGQTTLFTQKTISRRVARWYDELSEYPITFRYIPGTENAPADGISRRPDFAGSKSVTLASISTRQHIRRGVKRDLNDEQPRLVLSNICAIIDAVLYEFHDAKCYGHPGVERTLRLVEPHYYWRSIEKYIRVYVSSCEVCQRIKSRTTKPPGLLRSHPIPSVRWTHLVMDFIVALPETTSGGRTSYLLQLQRLHWKQHSFRDRVFVLHGLPEEVLSDRDSKFTSDLWTTLCEMLSTRQKLTAAFRQQANGITERVNQTIENFLRAFNNSNCDDWDTMLSLAEFAYNSRYQDSIKMSPFQADLGYLPVTPACREFKIGDLVLLSTTNLATFHAGTSKKELGPRWIGTYIVLARVGHDYYQLELPTRVKLHPIFHTSSLKPNVASSRGDQTLFKVLLPDGTEGELVEDIVRYRKGKGKKEYQVKWIGQVELTWEPLKNLE